VANSAYLYSLNGEGGGGGGGDTPSGGDPAGTGTVSDPYNVAAARNAVKDLTWTSNTEYQKTGTVYVKGKISKIADNGTFGQSGTFGNATFYISDDGKEGNDLYCYRILYLNNEKYTSGTDIKVGDDVVICGELMNYKGNTPETVANNAYLYSLNGSGGGVTPGPGEVKAVTVAEFNAAPESDTQVYELVGTIGGSINTTYGNFDLTDGTGTVYVYGLTATELGYGSKNDKSFASLGLVEGDKIKIRGYRGSFDGKIEVLNAWFIEKVSGGVTPSGNGSGTLDDPYTPAGAIDAVKDLTWTSNTVYDKTEKVYVKGKISRIASAGTYGESGTYGNASYWISADGSSEGEFQIFRSLYFNGEKYTEGTDIKVGDEVIVYGALMNYKGNTPETVANENWLYSLNGKTDGGSGGGGGVTPTGGDGTVSNPYSVPEAIDAVKDLTWTSNTVYDKTEKVYVKGKISRIASSGTYGESGTYGNASYWISADGTENNEFQIYRSLYFNGEKYTEGTDIKVGDEVIIYGALMNYKGNTPETVANENWLYSLNGKTDGGGGGVTPGGSSVSFATNADTQTWTAATDGTYGSGYGTTTQGVNIAYYKHTSTSNPVAPNSSHVRVYKNSALSIASAESKKIKKIVIGCAPDAGSTSYCFDMAGLEGGAGATADKSAFTVTWSGSANKVVLHANNGQIRMEKITVEFE
jgi:hypothetical protein